MYSDIDSVGKYFHTEAVEGKKKPQKQCEAHKEQGSGKRQTNLTSSQAITKRG